MLRWSLFLGQCLYQLTNGQSSSTVCLSLNQSRIRFVNGKTIEFRKSTMIIQEILFGYSSFVGFIRDDISSGEKREKNLIVHTSTNIYLSIVNQYTSVSPTCAKRKMCCLIIHLYLLSYNDKLFSSNQSRWMLLFAHRQPHYIDGWEPLAFFFFPNEKNPYTHILCSTLRRSSLINRTSHREKSWFLPIGIVRRAMYG